MRVAVAGDVGIDEASNGNVGGVFLLSQTDILLEMACLGYKRVHNASEESRVK